MTTGRIRGCKRIRSNAERGKERLEGFTPLIEDWHAKVAFLGVSTCVYIICLCVCAVLVLCVSIIL